jgi:hypothetical protein
MKVDLQREILKKLCFTDYAIDKDNMLSNTIITTHRNVVDYYPDKIFDEIDYGGTHYYVVFLKPEIFD